MRCAHDGFHTLRSQYDRERELLVYFWVCEGCDATLGEAARQPYRPHYDPRGHELRRLTPSPGAAR